MALALAFGGAPARALEAQTVAAPLAADFAALAQIDKLPLIPPDGAPETGSAPIGPPADAGRAASAGRRTLQRKRCRRLMRR